MDKAYGFDFKASLRERLILAWLLVRGRSVGYHIGCHGTALYVPDPGAVVGCEVRPEGFGEDEWHQAQPNNGFTIKDA